MIFLLVAVMIIHIEYRIAMFVGNKLLNEMGV